MTLRNSRLSQSEIKLLTAVKNKGITNLYTQGSLNNDFKSSSPGLFTIGSLVIKSDGKYFVITIMDFEGSDGEEFRIFIEEDPFFGKKERERFFHPPRLEILEKVTSFEKNYLLKFDNISIVNSLVNGSETDIGVIFHQGLNRTLIIISNSSVQIWLTQDPNTINSLLPKGVKEKQI
jgi:hypothetical protein